MNVEDFLKELRESADIQYKIFTEGSCFRLYRILKTVYPEAKPYWSDLENHCITEINGRFYDIGGKVRKEHVEDKGYYKIPKKLLKGYGLLKFVIREEETYSVKVEKY